MPLVTVHPSILQRRSQTVENQACRCRTPPWLDFRPPPSKTQTPDSASLFRSCVDAGVFCSRWFNRIRTWNVTDLIWLQLLLHKIGFVYPVSHPIMDRDFSAKYSRVASVAMAVGSCRTGPPADRNVLKTFDGICPTIGWESVYFSRKAADLYSFWMRSTTMLFYHPGG